jgi:predicted metal-binding membrane protein
VMNLVWVAAMAMFVLVEKIGPWGALVVRAAGVAMIAAGALVSIGSL